MANHPPNMAPSINSLLLGQIQREKSVPRARRARRKRRRRHPARPLAALANLLATLYGCRSRRTAW